MSHSSRASNLAQLRERLAQMNSEFFLLVSERRKASLDIQSLKEGGTGRYSHYDPERELALFKQFESELKELSLKELLAFSLIMEDQAQAFAPGAYPSWSQGGHLQHSTREIYEMINPLLFKFSHVSFLSKLQLTQEFQFLLQLP